MVVDPASDWPRFAEQARQLLAVDEVDAVGIDDDGRVTIRDRDGRSRGVAVGDVTHLRYA